MCGGAGTIVGSPREGFSRIGCGSTRSDSLGPPEAVPEAGALTRLCEGVGFENSLPRHVTGLPWRFFYFNSAPVPVLFPTGCKLGRLAVAGRGVASPVAHGAAKRSCCALADFAGRIKDHAPALKGDFNLLPASVPSKIFFRSFKNSCRRSTASSAEELPPRVLKLGS